VVQLLWADQEKSFIQRKRDFSDAIMDRLFVDPEVKGFLVRKIEKLNLKSTSKKILIV